MIFLIGMAAVAAIDFALFGKRNSVSTPDSVAVPVRVRWDDRY